MIGTLADTRAGLGRTVKVLSYRQVSGEPGVVIAEFDTSPRRKSMYVIRGMTNIVLHL